jgi:hypothetical protein
MARSSPMMGRGTKMFPLETKVAQKSHVEDGRVYDVGTVIATHNGKLIVQWWEDEDGDFGHVQKHDASELMTEEAATQRRAEMDAERSRLDSEFESYQQELSAKMSQATALVKEAAEIAKAHNKDFADMYSECRPLFRVLNEAGWRASTMQCS